MPPPSTPRRWAGWSASIWCSCSRRWCWRWPIDGAAITGASSEWRRRGAVTPPTHALRSLPDAAEFLGGLVEHRQRALGDAKIGTVQMQLAALGRRPDKWKRHQVFQASEDRRLLDPGGEIGHCLVVALSDPLAWLDEHRHPSADEVARRQRLDIVDEGADAAALRVA